MKKMLPYSDEKLAELMEITSDEMKFSPIRKEIKEIVSAYNLCAPRNVILEKLQTLKDTYAKADHYYSGLQKLIDYIQLGI